MHHTIKLIEFLSAHIITNSYRLHQMLILCCYQRFPWLIYFCIFVSEIWNDSEFSLLDVNYGKCSWIYFWLHWRVFFRSRIFSFESSSWFLFWGWRHKLNLILALQCLWIGLTHLIIEGFHQKSKLQPVRTQYSIPILSKNTRQAYRKYWISTQTSSTSCICQSNNR